MDVANGTPPEECFFCGLFVDNIKEHIKREHCYKCNKCKKKFHNVLKFEEHMKNEEEKEKEVEENRKRVASSISKEKVTKKIIILC